jgi:hypothetical protein
MDEKSVLGPVQNEMQYNKVRELVEDAKARGGRVLTGGQPIERPGYFYPITLVADVTDGVPLVDEEQFGPALPIIRYSDVDEVIERANRNPAGLGGSVWSSRPGEGEALCAEARMRLGLDQQARRDPAQCAFRRRQAIRHRRRIRRRRPQGIHHRPDRVELSHGELRLYHRRRRFLGLRARQPAVGKSGA